MFLSKYQIFHDNRQTLLKMVNFSFTVNNYGKICLIVLRFMDYGQLVQLLILKMFAPLTFSLFITVKKIFDNVIISPTVLFLAMTAMMVEMRDLLTNFQTRRLNDDCGRA